METNNKNYLNDIIEPSGSPSPLWMVWGQVSFTWACRSIMIGLVLEPECLVKSANKHALNISKTNTLYIFIIGPGLGLSHIEMAGSGSGLKSVISAFHFWG